MITGFGGASIWSEDLQNLLTFYRDTLGLAVQVDTPEFMVLGAAGSPTLALGTHSEVHGNNPDPARHMVSVTTDDVHADVARLRGMGVEFVDEPTDFGQVVLATCKDPEGNFVQLVQFTM